MALLTGAHCACAFGDVVVVVPSSVTARIQEFHLVRYHAIYEDVEDCLTEKL